MTLAEKIRGYLNDCDNRLQRFDIDTATDLLEQAAIELEAAETEKLWQQTAYLLSQPARGNA